jgi:hypothetical protein
MISNKKKTYAETHSVRFKRTFKFLDKVIDRNNKILDLGPKNQLSEYLENKGYVITNTPKNIDLDFDYEVVKSTEFNVVTAFEILEHLVSPFPLLYSIKAHKLIASVPLKLWFADAYWNPDDKYDRHYHEFEPKQFEMLLEKAGWHIKDSQKWTSKSNKVGIRPFLRWFVPRYYIVYCERSK